MASDMQLRVTLLGDGAVGKTSLRRQFLGKGFMSSHQMTIGADFAVLKDEISTDKGDFNVTYQIWDLAGQNSFKQVRARFFKGALGGVCVFDLTRRSTFQNISAWIEELWRHNGKGVVPIVLVGNKSDLDSREVKTIDGQKYADTISQKTRAKGFDVKYIETSAKTGDNVRDAFTHLGEIVINNLF